MSPKKKRSRKPKAARPLIPKEVSAWPEHLAPVPARQSPRSPAPATNAPIASLTPRPRLGPIQSRPAAAPGQEALAGGLSGVVPVATPRPQAAAPPAASTAAPPPPSSPPPPRLARRAAGTLVELSSVTCGPLQNADPQSLAVTYWLDAAPLDTPKSVTLHITGRLRGEAPAGRRESFEKLDSVDVIPGSGRVAVTTRIPDLPPGSWDVTVTPVQPAPAGSSTASTTTIADHRLPPGSASGPTAYGPLAAQCAPGVRLGAWPRLVAAGTLLALILQAVLASRLGLPVGPLLSLSLIACVLGLVGAKTYYILTHREERRSILTPGMSVQGFVLAAVAAMLAGAPLLGLPLGPVLDATAPGLLLGMAIGRLGCLLGGCCVGHPTKSRWGIWSSDRRMGVRRIPVQLLESAMAASLGVLTLVAVWQLRGEEDGLLFVAAIAAYTAGRQILFPLRDIPRTTAHGRIAAMITASAIAIAAGASLLV